MNIFSLFRVEYKRLIRTKLFMVIAVLTIVSPITGLFFYRVLESTSTSEYVTTVLGWYIANPSLAGGLFGGIGFAILTILELNRVEQSHVDNILYAIISPLTAAKVKFMALFAAVTVVQVITMIVWLPFTMIKTGYVFDMENYIWMYLIFMYAQIVTVLLFTISAYQFTKRADVSFVLVIVFFALGFTVFPKNWLLSWASPLVWAVSDDFTNHRILMSVAYMRLFWILVLSGSCLISYLCIRHYHKNLISSFLYHLRKVHALILAFILIGGGIYSYVYQPFLDHADFEVDYDAYYNYDMNESILCNYMRADVHPNGKTGCVYGTLHLKIQNNSGKEQKVSFYLDPGYKMSHVTANNKEIPYHVNHDDAINTITADVTLPADKEIELNFDYGGFPRYWSSCYSMQGDPEISEKYMCLERTCLAPELKDIIWDYENGTSIVDISVPDKLKVIPFGVAEAEIKKENTDGTNEWEVDLKNRPSTNLFIGDYVCDEFEESGVNVKFYYGRKHKEIMEQAKAVESIKSVIKYCSKHIAKLSFFDRNNTIKLIEKRVAGGGYAGNGASSLDEIDYTKMNLSNENKGSIPGEIIIHEMVHQWWGLGNMFDYDGTNNPWSSEGLTVYTSYRIVKELYGEEYAKKVYVDKWKERMKGYYDNYYIRHPEYLSCLPEKYKGEIANSLDEIRKYEEMPLKILKAQELVGGEEKMDKILNKLFTRDIDEENEYLTYQMFLDACGLSEEELNLE